MCFLPEYFLSHVANSLIRCWSAAEALGQAGVWATVLTWQDRLSPGATGPGLPLGSLAWGRAGSSGGGRGGQRSRAWRDGTLLAVLSFVGWSRGGLGDVPLHWGESGGAGSLVQKLMAGEAGGGPLKTLCQIWVQWDFPLCCSTVRLPSLEPSLSLGIGRPLLRLNFKWSCPGCIYISCNNYDKICKPWVEGHLSRDYHCRPVSLWSSNYKTNFFMNWLPENALVVIQTTEANTLLFPFRIKKEERNK